MKNAVCKFMWNNYKRLNSFFPDSADFAAKLMKRKCIGFNKCPIYFGKRQIYLEKLYSLSFAQFYYYC